MRETPFPFSDHSRKRHQIIAFFSLLKVGIISVLMGFVVVINLISRSEELLKTHVQWAVLTLVAIACGSLIVTALALKYREKSADRVFLGVLLIDLLITTVLVHLTGGANSPYAILFLVPVIAMAVVFSTLWAAWFTFIVLALYFGISIAGWTQLIPAVKGQFILPSQIPTLELVRRLSLNASAFATVSALSIYLARRLSQYENVVETTQREILELTFRHRDILNSLGDGVISLDNQGTILLANRMAVKILGEGAKKMANIRDLGPEFEEIFQFELRDKRLVITRDEVVTFLECSLTSLKRRGKKLGHVLLIRDRTEQEKLEVEMARQNHLASLGRLSAGIAHEIRNPLAAISGSLELVQRELGDDVSGDVPELLDIVFAEITRLNGLIGDLLTYTRNKPINAIEVDFGLFIKETLSLLRADPRSTGKTIAFDVPSEEITLMLEPDSMRQVVYNLVLNALEMKTTTVVTVQLSREENRCTLVVEDNGPGITSDAMRQIFEPFFTTKEKGTGLGLAIVSRLVEKHWGSIDCEASQSGGARFTVTLPMEL